MIKALATHIGLLLTFRHNGEGLDVQNNQLKMGLGAIMLVLCAAFDIMNPNISWVTAMIVNAIFLVIVYKFFNNKIFMSYVLLGIAFTFIRAGVVAIYPDATPLITFWSIAAYVTVMMRMSDKPNRS